MSSTAIFENWNEEQARQSLQVRDYLFQNTPFFVIGPPGIGKTAFISGLVFHPELGFPTEWVNLPSTADPLTNVNLTLHLLKDNPPEQPVIVVLDGAEVFSTMALGDIITSFRNLRVVRNVTATSRRSFNFPGVKEIVLSHSHEKLYGLKEQVIAVPHHGIIKTIAPIIVSANDLLIEKLKRQPTDLFKITARQFEEVIADLLTDMGMNVELTPQTRDGGKDILVYMDTELGKVLCLVETKQHRQSRPVGVQLVRSLYGSVKDSDATNGMLVTTSRFTSDAKTFQRRHQYTLSLKDYSDVLTWLLKYKQ